FDCDWSSDVCSSDLSYIGPSKCHDQCGAEAMPFGIGEGDHKRTVGHRNEIEVVTASFVGGTCGCTDVKTRYQWWGCIEALLHIARQLQLELLILLLPQFGDVLGH